MKRLPRRAARMLVLAAAVTAVSAEAAPALWAASDGDSTVYLFGTAHAVRPNSNWRTPELDAALASSTALWLEVRTAGDRNAAAALVQKLGLDRSRHLESRLPPALKAKLDAVLAQYGVPAARLSPMKPWLAGVTISMLPLAKAGLDAKAGADVGLRTSAAAQGDRIEGFETPEEQVRTLADLPEGEQLAFLESAVDRAAGGSDLPNKIAAAWESGDLAAIDSILNAEIKVKMPSLYRRLLVDRNSRYAERIKALLAGKEDQFVAVGVGHLVGVDGIPVLLERKGVKLRRIH
ncbi:MAG: TraB/GumN family protein [Allosphingosinicella sp.]